MMVCQSSQLKAHGRAGLKYLQIDNFGWKCGIFGRHLKILQSCLIVYSWGIYIGKIFDKNFLGILERIRKFGKISFLGLYFSYFGRLFRGFLIFHVIEYTAMSCDNKSLKPRKHRGAICEPLTGLRATAVGRVGGGTIVAHLEY